MEEKEIKALVSLLDDPDAEIFSHVESKIRDLGSDLIPYLEVQWEKTLNPITQKRIEELIHSLQYGLLKERFQKTPNIKFSPDKYKDHNIYLGKR